MEIQKFYMLVYGCNALLKDSNIWINSFLSSKYAVIESTCRKEKNKIYCAFSVLRFINIFIWCQVLSVIVVSLLEI